MAVKKTKKVSLEKASRKNSEEIDLNEYIEKKRIQNEVLKKLISKLNDNENPTIDK